MIVKDGISAGLYNVWVNGGYFSFHREVGETYSEYAMSIADFVKAVRAKASPGEPFGGLSVEELACFSVNAHKQRSIKLRPEPQVIQFLLLSC